MTRPAHDLAGGWQDQPRLAGDSPGGGGSAALPDGQEGGSSYRQPQPDAAPSEGGGHLPGLLFREAPSAGAAGDQDADRSFAPDLNLDQIVTAIAGDREERDLITKVLFGSLHEADAVRYRQEVSRTLITLPCSTKSSASPGACRRCAFTCVSWRRWNTLSPGGLAPGRGGRLLRRGAVTGGAPGLGADQIPRPAGLPGVPGFLCGVGRVHCLGKRYTEPEGGPRADPLLHPYPGRPGGGEPLPGGSRLQRLTSTRSPWIRVQ